MKDCIEDATAELAAAQDAEIMATVDREIGAIARPAKVRFVTVLPKTRSGKLLRRSTRRSARAATPGPHDDRGSGALEHIRAAIR